MNIYKVFTFFAQRRSLPNQQYAVDIKSPFRFRVKCHPKIIGRHMPPGHQMPPRRQMPLGGQMPPGCQMPTGRQMPSWRQMPTGHQRAP